MQGEENGDGDDEGPAEGAVGLRAWREEKRKQAAQPEGKAERLHHQNLLGQIGRGREDDVFAGGANVIHQLEEGPVVLDVPKEVGKKDQEGDGAAREKPRRE